MVRKLLSEAAQSLPDSESPMLDARVLLAAAAGVKDSHFLFELPQKEALDRFKSYLDMRRTGMPVAYILGEKEFMGMPFYLNRDTLIPRPDTERLVELIIEKQQFSAPSILDLCSGSGCIGISLASFIPLSTVHLTDICEGALDAEKKNILRHNLSDRVKSYKLDVLSEHINGDFDIIVSNPPYIETDVVKELEVSKSEPILALDGGKDGLDFYRVISKKAFSALKKGGMLALEIGYNQGKTVPCLLEAFSEVNVYKDYGNNDRVVIAIK